MFLQRARTRPKKSGPACNTQHGKQDSGSKSFEVVSWQQLGPYENNSIHPLLPKGLCKTVSSFFCNVPEQGPRNRAPRATLNMASKTQDQSLLKLYHCRSSDLMRIIQFIRSCPKGLCKPVFFMLLPRARTRPQKSGPACNTQHGKQDSGSKSFEVVSWPQLGPYENNSIHPLLPVSSFFCNVPEQGPRNWAPLATDNMASKTQDQSLLKLYHGRSSDLMRIIQFIRSCPFLYVSATCQNKAQEIGPRLQHSTWQARLRIKVFWSCIIAAARTLWE